MPYICTYTNTVLTGSVQQSEETENLADSKVQRTGSPLGFAFECSEARCSTTDDGCFEQVQQGLLAVM